MFDTLSIQGFTVLLPLFGKSLIHSYLFLVSASDTARSTRRQLSPAMAAACCLPGDGF